MKISEGPARAAADRLDRALAKLTEATSAEVSRAQTAVRALESRTWTMCSPRSGAACSPPSPPRLRRVPSHPLGAPAFRGDETGGRWQLRQAADRGFERRSRRPHARLHHMAEELREVEAHKQQFFSQISHELRIPSPLYAPPRSCSCGDRRICSMPRAPLGRVDRHQRGPPPQPRHADPGPQPAPGRRVPLELRPLELDKVVARALDVLGAQAEQQRVCLESTSTGLDFVITADEDGLTQVILNLTGNAIKFTQPGGVVRVGVTDAGRISSWWCETTGLEFRGGHPSGLRAVPAGTPGPQGIRARPGHRQGAGLCARRPRSPWRVRRGKAHA